MECKVVYIADLGLHTQFVGEVVNVKVDSAIQENDRQPLIEQIKPLIFAPDNRSYYAVGVEVGKAFSVGKAVG